MSPSILEGLGHEVYVVDPGRTKAIGATLIKNDKLDARVLAVICQANLLAVVHRPDQAQRLGRMPIAARDALVRSRTLLMNAVRSLLDSEGISIRGCSPRYFPGAVLVALEGPCVPDGLAKTIAPMLEALEQLTRSVKECDVSLEEAAAKDPIVRQLRTVPGVGPIVAAAFVYSIRDPKRFQSGRQVGAYLGLVPSLYSSGQTHRVGRITKQGSRQTRWLLTIAANALLRAREQSTVQRWGQELVARLGRKKAVVAVARKLASILWAMWRRGGAFEPRLLPATGSEEPQRQTAETRRLAVKVHSVGKCESNDDGHGTSVRQSRRRDGTPTGLSTSTRPQVEAERTSIYACSAPVLCAPLLDNRCIADGMGETAEAASTAQRGGPEVTARPGRRMARSAAART